MSRTLIVAATFAIALMQPAFAADAMKTGTMKSGEMMKCDDASMMKMQTEMDAMTDPAMKDQKAMAMKEMDMAKDSMKMQKADDCAMHMDEAMKAMTKG